MISSVLLRVGLATQLQNGVDGGTIHDVLRDTPQSRMDSVNSLQAPMGIRDGQVLRFKKEMVVPVIFVKMTGTTISFLKMLLLQQRIQASPVCESEDGLLDASARYCCHTGRGNTRR